MKLKSLSILIAFVVLVAFSFGNVVVAEDYQEVNISAASPFQPSHIFVRVADHFKELVESESDGKVTVDIFSGGVVGGEEEITEQVSIQAMEMQFAGGGNIEMYAPAYFDLITPYVMTDWEHFLRLHDSAFGDEMNESMIESGDTRLLSPMYRGVRQVTSNKRLETIEDFEGLSMRLPGLANWIKVWEEIGVESTPITMDELYTALATGVTEASEGEIEQIYTSRLYEVQDFVVMTNHLMSPGYISINNSFLEGLNQITRDLIIDAAVESAIWGSEQVDRREEELKEELIGHGIEIIEIDQDEMRNAALPAIEEIFEQNEVIDLEDVEQYR